MTLRTCAGLLTPLVFPTLVVAQSLTLSPTTIASTSGARAVAAADFDNNGWADVAHGNVGGNTVTILLNRGGSLAKAGDIAVGLGPFDMAAADFNLDGKADLAVANADANTISVLLGRGDGSFARADISAPGNPRGITAADMNRDGKPDIVYSRYGNGRVQALLGSGTGTFTAGRTYATGQRPQGVAAADFNKDGILDLAVAHASPDGLLIMTLGADGTWVSGKEGTATAVNVVTTGDFNKDGWLDVAAASSSGSRVYLSFGGGAGASGATYVTGSSPRGIAAADLDHDGWLDIVTANRWSNTITVLRGRADAPGTLTTTEFASGRGSRAVVAADFNHDGRRDVATGNQDAASATVLLNDTLLKRAAFGFTRGTLPSDQWNAGEQVVADLNHNHVPDLIMRDVNGTVAILDGATAVPIQSNYEVHAVADFNLDGHQDTMGRAWSGSSRVMRIMHGDGTGRFPEGVDLPFDSNGWFDVADMNRDGRTDLVVTHWEPLTQQAYVDVYLNGSDEDWSVVKRFQLSSRWAISITLADMNRDGLADVITSQFNPHMVHVMLGTGGGDLAPPVSYASRDYGYVHTSDVNEDGALDVVLGGWGQTEVWLGSRSGTLTAAAPLAFGGVWLAFGDMNQDGHTDIVSTYADAIAHGRGDGTFAEPERFRFATPHVAIADLNVDGLPDVIGSHIVAYNRRGTQNAPPALVYELRDYDLQYIWQFGEEDFDVTLYAEDPDMHALTYEWRDGSGEVIQRGPRDSYTLALPPGEYDLTATASDGRGGSVTDTSHILIRPNPELVLSRDSWHGYLWPNGTWTEVEDPTAAGGVRFHDPNRGAAKATAPLASPSNYVQVEFAADPTQTYKIWIRLKAEDNYWGNDSVFLQFSGATDVNGNPIYRTGTTSGLAVNLEECVNCGVSGWGWRDERWGPTLAAAPVLLRFPQGGTQYIIVQTREDGVSIDQIVLSAERYRTQAPGTAKEE